MATKRFRGGKYRYVVKNKKLLPKPINLTFENEYDGDAYVAELEDLLSKGIVPDEFGSEARSNIKLHELIKLYVKAVKITDDDRKFMRLHIDRLDNIDMGKLTYKWTESWVSDMKHRRKLTPGTITKHVGSLARCLDWGVNHEYISVNPLRTLRKGYAQYNSEDAQKAGIIRVDSERDRRLEEDEESRILAVISGEYTIDNRQRLLELEDRDALKVLFLLSLETGMRLREMYTLEINQINLDKRTIFLAETKNGDKRQVPLSNPAVELLTKYIQEYKPAFFLFPWLEGNISEHKLRKLTSRLSRQWRRIFEHAGCADLNFHDLRHEATSRFYERTNLSDLEISKITGHKDLRMLRRYANLRGSDLANRLW